MDNDLTGRDTKTLRLIARGYANKQIGVVLGISEQAVKNRITLIFAELNALDRTNAVVLALINGIISLDDIKKDIQEEN